MGKKRGKKPRSAAQQAATARMLAANRSGGTRTVYVRGARSTGRRLRSHTYGIAGTAGAALIAYGVAGPKQPGWTWDISPTSGETMSNRVHNMTQAIPFYGTDPNMANARALVGTGLVLGVGAKVVRHLAPWMRRTFSLKVARHAKVALV